MFHLSKEHIRPHYHGWVFRKGSIWKELIDHHILQCEQVSIIIITAPPTPVQFGLVSKVRQNLFSRLEVSRGKKAEADLEVLGLHYLILPFSLMAAGLGCALLVFTCEILCGKENKRSK